MRFSRETTIGGTDVFGKTVLRREGWREKKNKIKRHTLNLRKVLNLKRVLSLLAVAFFGGLCIFAMLSDNPPSLFVWDREIGIFGKIAGAMEGAFGVSSLIFVFLCLFLLVGEILGRKVSNAQTVALLLVPPIGSLFFESVGISGGIFSEKLQKILPFDFVLLKILFGLAFAVALFVSLNIKIPSAHIGDEESGDKDLKEGKREQEKSIAQGTEEVFPKRYETQTLELKEDVGETEERERDDENTVPASEMWEELRPEEEEEAESAELREERTLEKESSSEKKNWQTPPLDLLEDEDEFDFDPPEKLEKIARRLLEVLNSFGIRGRIISGKSGPIVNFFEFEPESGLRASRIVQMADDIAIAMKMEGLRIIAPVPGSGAVGFEIPRERRALVRLKGVITSPKFKKLKIPLAVGKDIYGSPFIIDLAELPHLLVAGATGSGKSVLLNACIVSLLYRFTPDELRLILIDPKMLEFSLYNGIPNLLCEVITDPALATDALTWAVEEMDRRYKLMMPLGVRNLDQFNAKAEEKLFKIVIIVDEFADLMVMASKKFEQNILRLSQKARAAGIHLILATQRPSVDVISGVIKANFPGRIALKVSSKEDSRVILGTNGAESLVGKGDFLFSFSGMKPKRGQGAFISEQEIERVVDFLKSQGEPEYIEIEVESGGGEQIAEGFESRDPVYQKAIEIARERGEISISFLQRKLGIGYPRAARIVDQLVEEGLLRQEGKKLVWNG